MHLIVFVHFALVVKPTKQFADKYAITFVYGVLVVCLLRDVVVKYLASVLHFDRFVSLAVLAVWTAVEAVVGRSFFAQPVFKDM